MTYGKGLGVIAVLERAASDGRQAGNPLEGLPAVSIGGATGHELPTALGTLITAERGGVSYTLVGSLPPNAAEAALRAVLGMTAVVEARGLVKTYGEITAVDHVDLTVEHGDVYGYLGPNGAGKTTSLRMLLGLIRPSSGSARLFGRDPMIDGVRALEGVAGFVEAPRFYPYLSGRKNLELVAALDGGDARSQIDAALDTVDLAARAKDRVGGYSHGMRQRLGIAGALIRRPQLLLLDEPATGLDPAGMRDMRALIRSLADSGITVLLSSHLMNEVEELCNRVAIIRAGRIVYEGRLDELRAIGGRQLHAAHVRRRRSPRRSARSTPGLQRLHRRARRPAHARRRGGDRGAQPRARALGRRAALARAGRGLARGALLRAHRGSPSRPRSSAARARAGGVMPHTATVYRWELRKLVAQKRTYLGLAAATIAPSIFVAALALQSGAPERRPVRPYVRDSGLAAPLVLLTFGSIWLFPLIASLVAGDIVAAEDGNGTLKTILTRSVTRGQLFAAKVGAAVTYALLALHRDGRRLAHRGDDRVGLQPDHEPLGHDRLGLARPAARVRQPRRLRAAAARDHGDRRAALDRHPQLRGRGRRRAHDRAADAADRHPARGRARSSRTC